MSDDLVKLEWEIRSDDCAKAYTPFGAYVIWKDPEHGFRWAYLMDDCYEEYNGKCEDLAEGMALAEEHWRECLKSVTKPLTDRIEELEAENKNLRHMIIDQIEAAGDDPEIMAASRAEWAARAKAAEDRIEELKAKLAWAMEAFDEVMNFIDIEAYDILKGGGMYKIAKAYADLGGVIPDEWADALNRAAELKGEK